VDGELVKLTIIPFDSSGTFAEGKPSGEPFVAQFNPTEYTDARELEMNADQIPHGADGNEAKVKGFKPRSWTFDLTFDGSGATGADGGQGATPSSVDSVNERLEAFKETVGFSGETHRQRFLQLVWGRLFVTCALESFSINYKLFDPAGTPIRAVVSATFKEHKDPVVQEREKNLASPDIPHTRLVAEGDTLPNLVNTVYRDTAATVAVARANDLNNLRRLPPGTRLRLPPSRPAEGP